MEPQVRLPVTLATRISLVRVSVSGAAPSSAMVLAGPPSPWTMTWTKTAAATPTTVAIIMRTLAALETARSSRMVSAQVHGEDGGVLVGHDDGERLARQGRVVDEDVLARAHRRGGGAPGSCGDAV